MAWGSGEGGNRRRSCAAVGVETLGARVLPSYLVVPRGATAVPAFVSDARANEPLFSNGLAVKNAPRFYGLYTGPRRPDLNGVRATAFLEGKNLVLSGTVAGPIITSPKNASQESAYVFGIDRGGSSKRGPYPNRPRIRFDALVAVVIRTTGTTAYYQTNTPQTNQPNSIETPLPKSDVKIQGDTVTVTIPFSDLPSTGHAVDQWNVNFMTRNPNQTPNAHGIASFTPEFTMFQVGVASPLEFAELPAGALHPPNH